MKYYRQNWAFINLPIGIVAALVAIFAWNALGATRAILLLQFAMVTNVFLFAPFYLLAAILNWTWLGITIAFMGFGQILIHGVITNIRLKWFYNNGSTTPACSPPSSASEDWAAGTSGTSSITTSPPA